MKLNWTIYASSGWIIYVRDGEWLLLFEVARGFLFVATDVANMAKCRVQMINMIETRVHNRYGFSLVGCKMFSARVTVKIFVPLERNGKYRDSVCGKPIKIKARYKHSTRNTRCIIACKTCSLWYTVTEVEKKENRTRNKRIVVKVEKDVYAPKIILKDANLLSTMVICQQ